MLYFKNKTNNKALLMEYTKILALKTKWLGGKSFGRRFL